MNAVKARRYGVSVTKPVARMRGIALLGMALVAVGTAAQTTQAITIDTPLRPVEIPGVTVRIPAGTFQESANVEQLCLPTSVRPPVRDKAQRDYVKAEDFRTVMQQGRQLATGSDWWARALGANTLIQRALPGGGSGTNTVGIRLSQEMIDKTDWSRTGVRPKAAPTTPAPQQQDVDFNFAVLKVAQTALETRQQSYYGNVHAMEHSTLAAISNSGVSGLERLELLKQLERFMDDNLVCVNERVMGRKTLDALIPYGWPVITVERTSAVAWHQENARQRQIFEQLNTDFERFSMSVFSVVRPAILTQIQGAKSSGELNQAMASLFGTGRLSKLALKDPDIGSGFTTRSTALLAENQNRQAAQQRQQMLEQERLAAANRARIVANVKANGTPTLADMQKLVIEGSMEMSIAGGGGSKGTLTSDHTYVLYETAMGRDWKVAEMDIQVSNLVCKPVEHMQQCSYDESSKVTAYRMLEQVVRPHDWSTDQVSGKFKWTANGLEAGPGGVLVTNWGRGRSGSSDGARASGSYNRDDKERDQFNEAANARTEAREEAQAEARRRYESDQEQRRLSNPRRCGPAPNIC